MKLSIPSTILALALGATALPTPTPTPTSDPVAIALSMASDFAATEPLSTHAHLPTKHLFPPFPGWSHRRPFPPLPTFSLFHHSINGTNGAAQPTGWNSTSTVNGSLNTANATSSTVNVTSTATIFLPTAIYTGPHDLPPNAAFSHYTASTSTTLPPNIAASLISSLLANLPTPATSVPVNMPPPAIYSNLPISTIEHEHEHLSIEPYPPRRPSMTTAHRIPAEEPNGIFPYPADSATLIVAHHHRPSPAKPTLPKKSVSGVCSPHAPIGYSCDLGVDLEEVDE